MGQWNRAAAALAIACATHAHAAPACHPALVVPPALAGKVAAICGINAPEDLEATPDGSHIVISENPGAVMHPGNLALLDTRTDAVAILPRPRDHGPVWGDPACPDPGGAAAFAPHGIHLDVRPDGALQLLVIDHAGGEKVEFYQLERVRGGMAAAWRGCVANPGSGMFNDVSGAPGGGFVATVMFDMAKVFRPDGSLSPAAVQSMLKGDDSGYLMAWAPGRTLHKLPGSDAPFNNGIQVSKDGQTIDFAAWTARQLRRYDVAGARITGRTDTDFLPDNISVAADGSYIAAGIPDAAIFLRCLQQKAAFCSSSFKIERYDPKSGTMAMLLDAPAGLMAGASVGLEIGHTLYVGSFSGDRVLKVQEGRGATPPRSHG